MTTDNNNNFRAQFNTYRKLVSLNQSRIAVLLGMTPNRFSEKLTGHAGAKFDLLEVKQIIKVLAQHSVFAEAAQASELLHILYPTHNFTHDEWQTEPLASLVNSPHHQTQNTNQDYLLAVAPIPNSVTLTTTTTTTKAVTATTAEFGSALNYNQPTIIMDSLIYNSGSSRPADAPVLYLTATPEPTKQVFRKLPPPELTPVVGRTEEIQRCISYLKNKTRLLTLTGMGGAGKTRLATEVVYKLDAEDIYENGIVFIPLIHVKTSTQLALELCATFGLPVAASDDIDNELVGEAIRLLINNLQAKHLLLVLDNVEQIVDDTAVELVTKILQFAPSVQMIVTSRELLRKEFEQVVVLQGLPLPPKDEANLATIASYDAVKLFINRIENGQPDFVFNAENARQVVELCYKLDGMPLALAIIAGQVKTKSIYKILAELNDRLAAGMAVYHSSPHRYDERHQTLYACIDFSYKLLDDELKLLFCRLGVFNGNATLEAITQICFDEPASKLTFGVKVTQLLNKLAYKSLVRIDSSGPITYYSLLEMPKQFAWCSLYEKSEDEARLRQERHASYYLAVTEQAAPAINQHADAQWINRLMADKANLLFALEYLIESGQVVKAYRMATALGPFWFRCNLFAEGVQWTNSVVSMTVATESLPDPLLQAKFLHQAGRLNNNLKEKRAKAVQFFSEAEKIWRELGDKKNLCLTLSGLGAAFYFEQSYEQADRYYEESANLARSVADDYSLAIALGNLTNSALIKHNYQAAKKFSIEGLATERKLKNQLGIGRRLRDLGFIAKNEKEYSLAKTLLLEGLDVFTKYGNYYSRHTCEILLYLSNVYCAQKDYSAAANKTKEGLQLTQENSFDDFLSFWILNVVLFLSLDSNNQNERIVILLGAIDNLSKKHPLNWQPDEKTSYDLLYAKMQATTFPKQFLEYKAEGYELAEDTLELYNILHQILDKILV